MREDGKITELRVAKPTFSKRAKLENKDLRERVILQSSLRDWKGMEWPKMARTSSSFLAFPVTKVTGRGRTNPEAADFIAAISQIFFDISAVTGTKHNH